MSAVQVGIRVPLGRPIPELADFAVRCEQAGPGGVGAPTITTPAGRPT